MDTPEKLTPREYAKQRSQQTGTIVQAQLIYYHIREGHLHLESCSCGRNVIDVRLANEYFDGKEHRNGKA